MRNFFLDFFLDWRCRATNQASSTALTLQREGEFALAWGLGGMARNKVRDRPDAIDPERSHGAVSPHFVGSGKGSDFDDESS